MRAHSSGTHHSLCECQFLNSLSSLFSPHTGTLVYFALSTWFPPISFYSNPPLMDLCPSMLEISFCMFQPLHLFPLEGHPDPTCSAFIVWADNASPFLPSSPAQIPSSFLDFKHFYPPSISALSSQHKYGNRFLFPEYKSLLQIKTWLQRSGLLHQDTSVIAVFNHWSFIASIKQ